MNLSVLYREVRNDQVLNVSVVAASDIIGILFIETQDVEIFFVQATDKVGVLDNKNEFRKGFPERVRQTFLVELSKVFTLVLGEVCIIRRIQEHKVVT